MTKHFIINMLKVLFIILISLSLSSAVYAKAQINPVSELTVETTGKSLHSVLGEIAKKGGPYVHMAADFGQELLQGGYSADSWAELLKQLLSGYNYYTKLGKDTGRITDVYVLGTNEKPEAKPEPPVEAEKVEKPAFCNADSAMPGGGPRNLARLKKKVCGEQ